MLLSGFALAGLVFATCTNVSAIVIGDFGTATVDAGLYQSGQGGEFRYKATSGPVGNAAYSAFTKDLGLAGSFQTFCLEAHEGIASPVDYVVNDEAILGGNNFHPPAGNMGGDIISVGTAYLYASFASGILAGYDYATTVAARKADAALLQDAIWALEDEIVSPLAGANFYYDLAVLLFGTAAAAKANASAGFLGVYVLNNTVSGEVKQDMLVFDNGASVPDGGLTLALLGIGLSGLGFFKRSKVA